MRYVDESEIIKEVYEKESDEDDEDDVRGKKNRTKNTFVGTAEYVSPEVLKDKGAGSATDLWALGCIIYQMFTGTTPFKDKTDYLIFLRIQNLNYTMPDNIPEEVKNLIKALLVIEPDNRLGAGLTDADDFNALKSHPFFNGIDFSKLNSIEPPFKKEFKLPPPKVIVPKNKPKQECPNETQKHKNTVAIIKEEIIEKKSPWFHYNTRKVVLDNTPKIEYIDPDKNIVKVFYE
jgi:3-phosphoinositide dependent protein kinase-1